MKENQSLHNNCEKTKYNNNLSQLSIDEKINFINQNKDNLELDERSKLILEEILEMRALEMKQYGF